MVLNVADVARLLAPTPPPSLQSSTAIISSQADLDLDRHHGAAQRHNRDPRRLEESYEGSKVHGRASGRLHHPFL